MIVVHSMFCSAMQQTREDSTLLPGCDYAVTHALQATTSKLQLSEMSVDAAQLELDNLKTNAREQDDVIGDLHAQLQEKQRLLEGISRAAHQHAKPTGSQLPDCKYLRHIPAA